MSWDHCGWACLVGNVWEPRARREAQWGHGWRGWRSRGSRQLQKLKATSSSVLLGISALLVVADSDVYRGQDTIFDGVRLASGE